MALDHGAIWEISSLLVCPRNVFVLLVWSLLCRARGHSFVYRVGSYGWALHHIIMVAVAGLAILFIGPLLLKGRWTGFCLAMLYWALGNIVNPFWYVFPHRWQARADGPTIFLLVINITWSLMVLTGIIGFFYSRRSTPNSTLQPLAQSSG